MTAYLPYVGANLVFALIRAITESSNDNVGATTGGLPLRYLKTNCITYGNTSTTTRPNGNWIKGEYKIRPYANYAPAKSPFGGQFRIQEMVVKPSDLKSSSKDRAGMFLSSPEMSTRERASTKEIFLSLPKRLNKAMA